MRCLDRNRRVLWHSRPTEVELLDDSGNRTGERVSTWSVPEMFLANVSTPSGDVTSSPFGNEVSYDLTVVMAGNPFGIEEGDRVWPKDDMPETVNDMLDMRGSYVVERVAASLNYVALGLRRGDGR